VEVREKVNKISDFGVVKKYLTKGNRDEYLGS